MIIPQRYLMKIRQLQVLARKTSPETWRRRADDDEIFSEHPKAALELVKTMANALEVGELSIGDEIFDNQASSWCDVPRSTRIVNFNRYISRPCDDYIARG